MGKDDKKPQEQPPKQSNSQPSKANRPSKEDYDPFLLEDVFPDLTTILQIPPSLSEIKKTCIFVLDASALLAPFGTTPQGLKDLSSIYQRLADSNRLFIPARALREFARNRAKKVAEGHLKLGQFQGSIKSLSPIDFPTIESVEGYSDLVELRKEINKKIDNYKERLGKLAAKVEEWNHSDDVSRMYAKLFTSGGLSTTV